jgi:ADP-dependent NAD(P)H-hydrate dehydratase / NAD(P)H-hydrate epimerase
VPRIPVLTTEELRQVEQRAAGRTPSLMERAGKATALLARRLADDTGAPVLVVAGPGNNGGDAWVAAQHLLKDFNRVVVLDVAGTPPKAPEAQAAKAAFQAAGKGEIAREWPVSLHPALVIDGMLGLGLTRDLDAPYIYLVSRINGSRVPVLSIDVPSGLDSATGCVRGAAVRASQTLTFIAHKVGLHTADGPDYCGQVEVESLGTHDDVMAIARGSLLSPPVVRSWLAPRLRNSHKGNYGSLGIIGGNRGMVGAALLAGRAALVTGAGKVSLGLLSPDAPPADLAQPELMLRPIDDVMGCDVIVAGPGAGQSPSATSVSMFERNVLPSLIAQGRSLVLDADALNAIAFNDQLRTAVAGRRKGATVLTPHPAEAGRLLGKTTAQVQGDRLPAALELTQRFKAHAVLKGTGSICAFPDGRWSINSTGNPGLASGGTGDVLAGMIGALLCQGLDAERALQYAVCLHGAAADALVARGKGPIGLTASEVSLEARRLMNVWTSR